MTDQAWPADKTIEVAVLCPTVGEYLRMLGQMKKVSELKTTTPMALGSIGGRTVLCCVCGKGQENTSATASRILERAKPRVLILTGIAGGFPDRKVFRGDVVVAHTVHSFDYGKLKNGVFERRPELDFNCDVGLLQHANLVIAENRQSWRKYIGIARPDRKVHGRSSAHNDCYVASSNKVVDDPDHPFYASVALTFPEIHAVEMEAIGIAAATRLHQSDHVVQFVMIRGISDEPGVVLAAGSAQRAKWRKYASEVAAAFTWRLIEQLAKSMPKQAEAAKANPRKRELGDPFQTVDPLPGKPRVFVSYSWDSEQHQKWVIAFSSRLRKDGVEVVLDHWHLQPGGDRTLFMEKSVEQASRVIVVCTDHYAKKANQRLGGVGYEAMIITSELAASIHSEKFIPVLRSGDWSSASPIWIKSKIGVDLRGETYSEAEYTRLLRALHQKPEEPPLVGPVPLFGAVNGPLAEASPSIDLVSAAVPLPLGALDDSVAYERSFSLAKEALDQGFQTILHHGYGDFFPNPPEWKIVQSNWEELKDSLSRINLLEYQPFRPTRAFAPKSKINLRPVTLLHPVDLILYTSLVSGVVAAIDEKRIPESDDRVFSFRYAGEDNELYSNEPSHAEFAEEKRRRAMKHTDGWMGFADIADFYSQLRHRPIREALDSCVSDSKELERYPSVIVRFLQNLNADAETYGIPIGPAASRPLAEAALIQIDDALLASEIDFIRYIDDFVIFSATRERAEWGIRKLGELLATQLGLTLHAAKTKLQRCSDFLARASSGESPEDTVESRFAQLIEDHFYDESGRLLEDLSEEEREALNSVDLEKILNESLDEDEIDYKRVAFILDKLASLQRVDLAELIVSHLHRLYPVAHAVRSFFVVNGSLLADDKKTYASKLLEPILASGPDQAPEFYSIWILDLFRSDATWNHAIQLGRIFKETGSQAVRRYCALALSVSGGHSEALMLKQVFASSDDMTRCGLLLGSGKLSQQEKRRWLERSELDWFESFLVKHS